MPEPTIVYAPLLDAEVRAIADQVRPRAFDFRNVAPADLPEALMDADYLCGFIGPIPTDVLVAAASKRLKLVQLMSAGYDRFNIEGARAARLPVADNGGANAIAVAEHAIMLMLSALKHVHALDGSVRQGHWRGGVGRVYELYGSTVGIVGMGRIGREVAKRLSGWDANLIYYDPVRLSDDVERQFNVRYVELDQLLRTADAVTVHVPLNARTRNLVDAESLSLMKPSAVLVNTARGGLVDEDALASALRDGQLLGAGLDVFSQEPIRADNPLLEFQNVTLTPHSAGPTWQSFPRRFANCFANIERVQRGEKPMWIVEELADLF
ncbi:MAG TPA: 2-hydroxyacid dehydrogenase [Chloroflexota bacterium]|jgi:phosphoglycerate dehydrogenase-like enzyme